MVKFWNFRLLVMPTSGHTALDGHEYLTQTFSRLKKIFSFKFGHFIPVIFSIWIRAAIPILFFVHFLYFQAHSFLLILIWKIVHRPGIWCNYSNSQPLNSESIPRVSVLCIRDHCKAWKFPGRPLESQYHTRICDR